MAVIPVDMGMQHARRGARDKNTHDKQAQQHSHAKRTASDAAAELGDERNH